MKRREFLVRAGLTSVVVPTLGRAAIPCPAPKVTGGGGQSVTTACSAVDPTSDWMARISGPGVVWYNGFATRAEVDLFRWAQAVNGNDPTASAPDAHYMQWTASGGPGNFPYLSITRPAGSKEVDTFWWRPLSPFTGATNGKGVNDPGANGTVTLKTWAPQGNVNELVHWPAGWYSNNSSLNPDGVDFWIQIRVKMDPNASKSGMNSPCKFFEIGIARQTLTNQNLVTYLNGSYTSPSLNFNRIYVDGSIWDYTSAAFVAFDNMSVSDPHVPTNEPSSGYSEQIGSSTFNPPTGYCNVANVAPGSAAACWAYSFGWDTLLYHITPGPVALTGPHGGTVCSIQTYAAHQGETSYTKIRDQTYELQSWNGTNQEGYQTLYLATYSNWLNQPFSFTSSYGQIICSKQFIPCPQA